MTQERNWAEWDKLMRDNPTLEHCYNQGHTHAAYGWGRKPWGHWSQEQKDAYAKGYEANLDFRNSR